MTQVKVFQNTNYEHTQDDCNVWLGTLTSTQQVVGLRVSTSAQTKHGAGSTTITTLIVLYKDIDEDEDEEDE